MLRLSPHGGGIFIVESLFATFSPCGGNFATFFSVWGAFFHNLKVFFALFFHVEAVLLRLSPYGGLFSPFKGISATFFLYVKAFLLRFSCGGGGGFYLLKAFFSPCGGVFMGTLFSLPPPHQNFGGAHACVSLNPYE